MELLGRALSACVTSSTAVPFLKNKIAFDLVATQATANCEDVLVKVPQNQVRAKQVPLPFYKRPRALSILDQRTGKTKPYTSSASVLKKVTRT